MTGHDREQTPSSAHRFAEEGSAGLHDEHRHDGKPRVGDAFRRHPARRSTSTSIRRSGATGCFAPASRILKPGELPAPDSISAVPDGAKALDGPARQGLLKVAADQRAEIDQAMEQLWSDRASIAKDLGTLAPNADEGTALNARMLAAREANRKVQALAAYTDEQEALANHAVVGHLNTAAGDIEHMATKNPQIGARYAKVLAVIVQRREAIVAGMARAKASKATDPKKG